LKICHYLTKLRRTKQSILVFWGHFVGGHIDIGVAEDYNNAGITYHLLYLGWHRLAPNYGAYLLQSNDSAALSLTLGDVTAGL